MGLLRVPHLVAILLLGAHVCGCATSSLPGLPLASRFGGRSQAEPQTDDFDPFPPLSGSENLATSDDAAVRDAIQTVAHSIPSEPEPPAAVPGTELAGHDAATRQLIEEELREATPQERRAMIRDLQGVDPPMVRQILKIRRMVRQMGQTDESPTMAQNPLDAGLATTASHSADSFDPIGDGDREAGGHSVVPAAGHSLAADDGNPFKESQMAAWPDGDVHHATVRTADVRAAFEESFGHSAADAPGQRSPSGHSETRVRPEAQQTTSQYGDIPVIDASEHFAARQNRKRTAKVEPRWGREDPASHSAPAPQDGAPRGLEQDGMHRPISWEDALHRAISEVEAEVVRLTPGADDQERHEYITRHVALRMLYFVAGEQERALQAVPYIEPADQEFWQQMFWAISNYFDSKGMPDSSDRATQTVSQLKLAVQRLQEKARLELRNVAFCHKIASYGNYERFNRDEFSPGQPVLLYAEVDNFKSEPTADGQYRTILKSTIEVYKAGPNGDLVYREPFAATEDLCRNYRRDYFHSYEFSIPQRIALGPHVLKLTVEDQLSRKLATYTLNFTVK